MYTNYDTQQSQEKQLMARWEKALNANGGIADESKSRLTAAVLETYLGHLKSTPSLINEDRMENGAFQGVNMAILGVLARAIPKIVGLDLVGFQAMTTPRSPVFHKRFFKDTAKGGTERGAELYVSPQDVELGIDPDYSSQIVKEVFKEFTDAAVLPKAFDWANRPSPKKFGDNGTTRNRVFVFKGSIYVDLFENDTDPKPFASISFNGFDPQGPAGSQVGVLVGEGAVTAGMPTITMDAAGIMSLNFALEAAPVVDLLDKDGNTVTKTAIKTMLEYEYDQQNESNMVEMSYKIEEVGDIRAKSRKLRAKFTTESEYDAKRYWGLNLQDELFTSVETELIAEINRDVVRDLRMMAYIVEVLDFTKPGAGGIVPSTAGNYEDMHRYFLDAIEAVCAKIWNVSRIGRGNWLLGNPVTLAFMDRIPGFQNSGVSLTGGTLAYAGQLGSKIKIYHDPTYPQDELLIGYKGKGALDSGYLHCPYLPLTSTPILTDPETGEPTKIFATRYGKTYDQRDALPNKIFMGEYLYARLKLKGMPTILGGSYSY